MPVIRKLSLAVLLGALALVLAAGPAFSAAQTKKVLIKSVKEMGSLVILMDGSQWRIDDPAEEDIVYDWLPFQTVAVKADNKTLVNLHRGDIVEASMIKPPTTKVASTSGGAQYRSGTVVGGTAGKGAAPATVVQVPQDLLNRLDKIIKRLEDLEFGLKSVEMRLLRLERMAGVGP